MKKIALIIMIIGIGFLSVGGFQFIKMKYAEQKSFIEAKSVVSENDSFSQSGDSENNSINNSFSPEQGDTVGIIKIPSIKAEFSIVEGTEASQLEKGVGHYLGSAYPMENDQIVLSGHRDTVFRNLGEMKTGDQIIIQLPYGEFTYEMVDYKIVEADDRTIIKSTAPEETLILTTCYPFGYIGNAEQRYIVYAVPVNKN